MDNEKEFTSRIDLSALRESVENIKREIAKVIVGQDRMIDLLVTAILADGHVLIEGVPGVAKTLTAKLLARIVDTDFARIQFTPDLMPSDILGTSVFNMKSSEFEFRAGPIFSNIILIDEINRAPAKTQAALFEVMEERQITVDGTTSKMEEPYMVLATQNPIEQEGTYRLPEAQLDRFLFKINVGYPKLDEEIRILESHHQNKNLKDLSTITPVLKPKDILDYREKVSTIHLDNNLLKYIAQIVAQTRENNALYLGASPRASVYLMNGAKAYAALQGRDFVTPEDVKSLVNPVLNHRVILTPEKEMEGLGAEDILNQVTESVEVPR